jgi:hypothetical protein
MANILTEVKTILLDLEPEFIKEEPVVTAWALNGGLAVLLGSVVGITHTQEAAVTTIVTGVVALYTMLRTKEFVVSTLTGTITTIAVAAAAFGLHLPTQELGVLVAVAAGVIPLVLRQNVSPSAAAPKAPAVLYKQPTTQWRPRPVPPEVSE